MIRRAADVVWCLVVLAFAGGACGQGVAWDRTFRAVEAGLARATNGDVYVGSIHYDEGGYFYVTFDRYAAHGAHLAHVVSSIGHGLYSSAEVHALALRGSYVMMIWSASGSTPGAPPRTIVSRLNLSTNAVSSGAGLSFGAKDAAIGSSTYCVVGYDETTSVYRAQVRAIDDDSLLRESTNANALFQKCILSGSGTYYIAGTYYSNGNRVAVTRMTSSATFTLSATANTLATPRLELALSSPHLYLAAEGEVLGFYRTFRTDTSSFQQERSFDPDDGELIGLAGIGSGNALVFFADRVEFISSIGPPNYTQSPYSDGRDAVALTDAEGNVVSLIRRATSLELLRFSRARSGAVMNEHSMPFEAARRVNFSLDAAGVVRAVFDVRLQHLEREFHVAQIDQASLDLPGPYTVGGETLIGTIDLGGSAPVARTLELFSNHPAAIVPPTVTIAAGQSSATFVVNTTPVATNAKPLINARYEGLILQETFDLAAPLIESVSASPQSQYGGNPIQGRVQLTGKAPAAGKVVALSSSNTAKATVPASTTIASGGDAKFFTIATSPTLVNASSVITASTGAVSKTVFIAINAPVLLSAALANGSIQGGTSTTMTVTLNSRAPSGYTVTLLSGSSALVQLPSSYAVQAGATSQNIPVLTSPVSASTPVTLVAYRGPYVKAMTLTLAP